MTLEQFQFLLETWESYSFEFDGKKYQMFYEKYNDQKECITLGELYMTPEKFDSFKALFANAHIENVYFKELVKKF